MYVILEILESLVLETGKKKSPSYFDFLATFDDRLLHMANLPLPLSRNISIVTLKLKSLTYQMLALVSETIMSSQIKRFSVPSFGRRIRKNPLSTIAPC